MRAPTVIILKFNVIFDLAPFLYLNGDKRLETTIALEQVHFRKKKELADIEEPF